MKTLFLHQGKILRKVFNELIAMSIQYHERFDVALVPSLSFLSFLFIRFLKFTTFMNAKKLRKH